ncbi:MAG: peptide deformylase [Desulfamplus sp.]|nr:peptide deformylase [Desulfamplus sp.]
MTILKIIEYPDPFLTLKAKPVENIDEEILKLIKDMADTMFNAPGVGLAAPQVRSDKRVIVYNPNARDERDEKRSEAYGNSNEKDEDGFDQGSNVDGTNKDISVNQEEYRAIINPEIIAASGSLISENEACLSVPDYSADVRRFSKITVKGLNVDGKKIQFSAEDIQAVIIQHEIDHLDGVLYIDRISMLKRNMYKKKIKKRSLNK